MAIKQCVILKGRKDGITIWLDEHADIKQIRQQLQKKVAGARLFFAGANAHVAFTGRTLSDEEEKSLLDIILAETTLELTFVEQDGFTVSRGTQAQPAHPQAGVLTQSPAFQKTDTTKTDVEKKADDARITLFTDAPDATAETPSGASTAILAPSVAANGGSRASHIDYMTAFYQNGLRSGQYIRYHGSVVVTGDVNPGSEIVADGNIVVLGRLQGMVHAGAAGDDRCFVSALSLVPTQLRIAGVITYIPRTGNGRRAHTYAPACAYMQNGQVYIAPL